jgi:L-ascorbate metabolism protein UlaG (beta-lactamase superfamily)
MGAQHTDPGEAVRILEDLEARRAVGIHWGVFQLTDEPRNEPPELLLEALTRRGIAKESFPAGEPGMSYESTASPTAPAALHEVKVKSWAGPSEAE